MPLSFFETQTCQRGKHCQTCRARTPQGQTFRLSVGIGEADCPHGKAWESQSITPITINGAAPTVAEGAAPKSKGCGSCSRAKREK